MVRGEFVIVPRKEYERLAKGRERVPPTFIGYENRVWKGKKYAIPTYQLYGKAAVGLDKEVKQALREYKQGKTKKIKSLADLER